MSNVLKKLGWETSQQNAFIYEDVEDLGQAEFGVGAFLDFRLDSGPYAACLPLDNLGSLFQLPSLGYTPMLAYPTIDVITDLQHFSHYGIWAHDEQELAMARLEDAAIAKDEHTFLEALRLVEWQNRPPTDFVRAAQLALKAGAYAAAHQISVEGMKHHPDDPEIQKYARVLAPPRVMPSNGVSGSRHRANREWLKAHGGEYSGQWVAVSDGKLLGAAGSLRELVKQVGDTKDALLTKAF